MIKFYFVLCTYKQKLRNMNTKDLKIIKHRKSNFGNLFVVIDNEGFSGLFRITYVDKSRKNSRYNCLEAGEVYFEGFSDITAGGFIVDVNHVTCRIQSVTDACLFVERNRQWIIEQLLK